MNIEEERKAFEVWFNKQTLNAIPDANLSMQKLWALLAWQASANREGSVLKEIKDCIEVNFDPDREDDQHSYWSGYNQAFRELKFIIETQEQSNESN